MSRPPVDKRPKNPKPMKFTERDGHILEAIHAFDGVLADYQIKRLFFTGEAQKRARLSLLWQHGYLARPDRRRFAAFPIYWLDERGAEYVAGLHGQDLSEFSYRKQPRWSLVPHDLAVNDFRLDVREACQTHPELQLEEWIPGGEFWAYPDAVEYLSADGKKDKRRVRPDGYFVIAQGKSRFRFLLELDRATEDNPRFAREKVRPGVAYLGSQAYEKRFGHKSGRWLVVTTGERRMLNMKRQAQEAVGAAAKVFCFTTFEAVKPETVLTAPIWYRGGVDEPLVLFQVG